MITGYIVERCEDGSDKWMRCNARLCQDLSYKVGTGVVQPILLFTVIKVFNLEHNKNPEHSVICSSCCMYLCLFWCCSFRWLV